MKRQRGIAFLAFMFAFAAASLGFSQPSGTTDTTSTSINTINVVANTGGDGRQLIQGIQGSGTTIIPGITSGNGPWNPAWPVLNRCISVAELMATPSGHSKIRMYKERAPVVRTKPIDQVCLINWQPDVIAYGDDRKIAEATGTGKDGYPDDAAFIPTLKKLVMETNTRRVAVQRRSLGVFHTKIISGGLGAASSVTADNNVGGSGAFGISIGSSKTKNEDPVEFYMIALNDGPIDRPVVQEPPKTNDSAAPQHESAAPPVQTIKVEVDLTPLASVLQQLLPLKPAPASASNTATTASECDIPSLTIYFDFAKANVKDEYRDGIIGMAGWIKAHPMCKVQVQGHASKEASRNYNVILAQDRWDAVRNALLTAGAPSNNLEGASLGKDFPKSDYEKENRRVVLVVQGPASGR